MAKDVEVIMNYDSQQPTQPCKLGLQMGMPALGELDGSHHMRADRAQRA
jgi:hypothetical protein